MKQKAAMISRHAAVVALHELTKSAPQPGDGVERECNGARSCDHAPRKIGSGAQGATGGNKRCSSINGDANGVANPIPRSIQQK
jgi:hypothetical protein